MAEYIKLKEQEEVENIKLKEREEIVRKERKFLTQGELGWSIEEANYSLLMYYEKQYSDNMKRILEKDVLNTNDRYQLKTYRMVLKKIERQHHLLMIYAITKSILLVFSGLGIVGVLGALVYYVIVPWWSWVWFGGFMGVYIILNGVGITSCYRDHITPMISFTVNTILSFVCIGFGYINYSREIRFHLFLYTFIVTVCLYIISIIVGLSVYLYKGKEGHYCDEDTQPKNEREDDKV